MYQTITSRTPGIGHDSPPRANRIMALLGGSHPVSNETRVLSANYQSCMVRPADLDAFLQGPFARL